MTHLDRPLIVALLLALLVAPAAAEAPAWTWIHGALPDADAQSAYMELAARVHAYYQDHGEMPGPLVAADDCDPWPDDHVVFIGPLAAFDDPARFGLPLSIEGDGVRVGAQTLDDPGLGIYLRNAAHTRVLFTGLSEQGFADVFTVSTGGRRCTVTGGRGRVLYATDDLTGSRDLDASSFLPPFPSGEDLAGPEAPAGALTLAPAAGPDALDPAFAAWLDGFVADQRVLFFGEGHWNRGVNRFFHHLVEHLLQSGDLRAVFLENNYSFSGYLDHYVTEPDPAVARELLAARVHHMAPSESGIELLNLLRAWNLAHPDRLVRVGCVDMEWSSLNVILHVIMPYFRLLDPGFSFDLNDDALRTKMQARLDEARARGLVGEFPFLTPDYMASVLDNLWTTLDLDDFSADRQRGIIRNISERQGRLLDDGLVVFKGGGWHAVKTRQSDENYHRDAAWLHLEHPSTKGRVVTLQARSLGYRFGPVADLDLARRQRSARTYYTFVQDFQTALGEGRAGRDVHYLIAGDRLSDFERLVVRKGDAAGWNAVHVAGVDWSAMDAAWGAGAEAIEARNYDAAVFILRSDIEVMRPIRYVE